MFSKQRISALPHSIVDASMLGINNSSFEGITKLCQRKNFQRLTRPDDSSHQLEIARLVLPSRDFGPQVLHTHPGLGILELFCTSELLKRVEQIVGRNCPVIRRASINYLNETDVISRHRDTEQDPDLKLVCVLSIQAAGSGGEHILYRDGEDIPPIQLTPGQILFSDPDQLHSVCKVLQGERITLVVWFSDYSGPLRSTPP